MSFTCVLYATILTSVIYGITAMVLPTFSGKIKQKSLWELPAELTQARRFGKTRSAQSTALLEDYKS